MAKPSPILMGVFSCTLSGCIAQIDEVRTEGVVRPDPYARSEVVVEYSASAGPSKCRDVLVTAPALKEVDIRRSYSDPLVQERNMAAALLLAAGFGLLVYGSGVAGCPEAGGGCRGVTVALDALLGLEALPLGFIGYNARRAQDSRFLERTEPERQPGPWHPCATEQPPHAANGEATPEP